MSWVAHTRVIFQGPATGDGDPADRKKKKAATRVHCAVLLLNLLFTYDVADVHAVARLLLLLLLLHVSVLAGSR